MLGSQPHSSNSSRIRSTFFAPWRSRLTSFPLKRSSRRFLSYTGTSRSAVSLNTTTTGESARQGSSARLTPASGRTTSLPCEAALIAVPPPKSSPRQPCPASRFPGIALTSCSLSNLVHHCLLSHTRTFCIRNPIPRASVLRRETGCPNGSHGFQHSEEKACELYRAC